jgi:glycopeptide antibiotics resistance protein
MKVAARAFRRNLRRPVPHWLLGSSVIQLTIMVIVLMALQAYATEQILPVAFCTFGGCIGLFIAGLAIRERNHRRRKLRGFEPLFRQRPLS